MTLDDVREIIRIAFENTGEDYNGMWCNCGTEDHKAHMEEFISTVLSEFHAMRKRERQDNE